MTSFTFVSKCGVCHPGGGPLEHDRAGKRYDRFMSDPASGMTSGGDNGLDGDYYKARWSESGVVEADCLLCHMPDYNLSARNAQLAALNFRWAATVGAGLATVDGAVGKGESPKLAYDRAKFQPDGTLLVHTVRQPRTETCLRCHGKSDWKKRGAAYSPRTDVHLAKGLRCVDCHTAGSQASDPRIRGKELHQFGKGDDPGGFVRNDLDDTVRDCASCHADGTLGAPVATHAWLPPLHLERIACQTCHIPWRQVKSALVQASDVYNPGPHITPPGKHVWTFYDAGRACWNHYGENTMFRVSDQPTDPFRPTLARYKGKIYPVNRIHSTFVGYEEQGRAGIIGQLLMADFYKMWAVHRASPKTTYPELARIADDDRDGVIEVNRPEEIDALLGAVRTHLGQSGFSLAHRRLVWVSDSTAHYSSKERRPLARQDHEATAFASVYKYSHDVAPARAALGARGCVDCHAAGADFFERRVLASAFGNSGGPVWMPNHQLLGLSAAWVGLGAFREQRLKPAIYGALLLFAILAGALLLRISAERLGAVRPARARALGLAAAMVCAAGLVLVALEQDLLAYITASRFELDANHFWIAAAALAGSLLAAWLPLDGGDQATRLKRQVRRAAGILALAALVAGAVMLVLGSGLSAPARLAYTVFDVAIFLLLASGAIHLLLHLAAVRTEGEA